MSLIGLKDLPNLLKGYKMEEKVCMNSKGLYNIEEEIRKKLEELEKKNRENSVRIGNSYSVKVGDTTYRAMLSDGGWVILNIEAEVEHTTIMEITHLPALVSLFNCLIKEDEASQKDKIKCG